MAGRLPAGFEALEPWVEAGWAAASTEQRAWHRYCTPRAQVEAFYGAMVGYMERAIEHLNAHDLSALPEPEQRLMALAQSFMEAALPVERLRRPNPQMYDVMRASFLPDYGEDSGAWATAPGTAPR